MKYYLSVLDFRRFIHPGAPRLLSFVVSIFYMHDIIIRMFNIWNITGQLLAWY